VVLASGLSTRHCWSPLGRTPPEAVRRPGGGAASSGWRPGLRALAGVRLVWQGVNLILGPDGRLMAGATLEPGQVAIPRPGNHCFSSVVSAGLACVSRNLVRPLASGFRAQAHRADRRPARGARAGGWCVAAALPHGILLSAGQRPVGH